MEGRARCAEPEAVWSFEQAPHGRRTICHQTILFGGKSCADHGELAQRTKQPRVRRTGHDLPSNRGLELSETACLIVGIFQPQENDTRSLPRDCARQMRSIDTIARIKRDRYRSSKPENGNRHAALRKRVLR